MITSHHDLQRFGAHLETLGLGAAAVTALMLAGPTTPTGVGLALTIAVLGFVVLDHCRRRPRFSMRRVILRGHQYRAWRAWDEERDRWCILVRPTGDPRGSVAALAEARRTMALGPAYDTEPGAEGPLWIFEARSPA